jgi:hypothetical protein
VRFSLNDVSASLLDYQHSMSFCFHIFPSSFRGISTLKTYQRKKFQLYFYAWFGGKDSREVLERRSEIVSFQLANHKSKMHLKVQIVHTLRFT